MWEIEQWYNIMRKTQISEANCAWRNIWGVLEQWVKDLMLPQLWSLLWLGFDSWPGNFHMLRVLPGPKKKLGVDGEEVARRVLRFMSCCSHRIRPDLSKAYIHAALIRLEMMNQAKASVVNRYAFNLHITNKKPHVFWRRLWFQPTWLL